MELGDGDEIRMVNEFMIAVKFRKTYRGRNAGLPSPAGQPSIQELAIRSDSAA